MPKGSVNPDICFLRPPVKYIQESRKSSEGTRVTSSIGLQSCNDNNRRKKKEVVYTKVTSKQSLLPSIAILSSKRGGREAKMGSRSVYPIKVLQWRPSSPDSPRGFLSLYYPRQRMSFIIPPTLKTGQWLTRNDKVRTSFLECLADWWKLGFLEYYGKMFLYWNFRCDPLLC